MNPTKEQIIQAYEAGRASVGDRDPHCPYPEGDLADAYYEGRDDEDLALGENFAESCDPSMRDVYHPDD